MQYDAKAGQLQAHAHGKKMGCGLENYGASIFNASSTEFTGYVRRSVMATKRSVQ